MGEIKRIRKTMLGEPISNDDDNARKTCQTQTIKRFVVDEESKAGGWKTIYLDK